jgi:hypothetical protein
LENSDDNVDIISAWESFREDMHILAKESLGCYELEQLKPWFDEECLKLRCEGTI